MRFLRKWPFGARLTRPANPSPAPLTLYEVEVLRDWSLKGIPTSAQLTLSLIEAYYEARGMK